MGKNPLIITNVLSSLRKRTKSSASIEEHDCAVPRHVATSPWRAHRSLRGEPSTYKSFVDRIARRRFFSFISKKGTRLKDSSFIPENQGFPIWNIHTDKKTNPTSNCIPYSNDRTFPSPRRLFMNLIVFDFILDAAMQRMSQNTSLLHDVRSMFHVIGRTSLTTRQRARRKTTSD